MTDTTPAEREAFEAWWDSDFRPNDDKLYEAAWNVWQARAARQPAKAIVQHPETSRFHKALAADLAASQRANPMRCGKCGVVFADRQPGSLCPLCFRELEASQPAQETVGDVVWVGSAACVQWHGQQPRAGTKLYAAPLSDQARQDRIREALYHLSWRAGGEFSDDQLDTVLKVYDAALEREVRKV